MGKFVLIFLRALPTLAVDGVSSYGSGPASVVLSTWARAGERGGGDR